MVITKFNEYKILDMAHGEKVEDWNGVLLRRPDPQVIWNNESNPEIWKNRGSFDAENPLLKSITPHFI